MSNLNRFLFVLIPFLFITCSKDSESPTDPGNGGNYNPNGHWSLPVFMNDIFENKYNPSISGDGKTLYCSDGYYNIIYSSTNDGSGWSQLDQLPLTNCTDPCISYDGNTLFFTNNGIYKSIRTGTNWSQPDSILAGSNPSITQDAKTLFYVKQTGTFPNISYGIFYASLENNTWVEKGGISEVNSLGNTSDPGISGDGTLLFFTRSEGNGYKIYYTKKVNNVWQSPQVLGNDINFTTENYTACVSWDKMKLYYSTYTTGGSGPKAGIYLASWINE